MRAWSCAYAHDQARISKVTPQMGYYAKVSKLQFRDSLLLGQTRGDAIAKKEVPLCGDLLSDGSDKSDEP